MKFLSYAVLLVKVGFADLIDRYYMGWTYEARVLSFFSSNFLCGVKLTCLFKVTFESI